MVSVFYILVLLVRFLWLLGVALNLFCHRSVHYFYFNFNIFNIFAMIMVSHFSTFISYRSVPAYIILSFCYYLPTFTSNIARVPCFPAQIFGGYSKVHYLYGFFKLPLNDLSFLGFCHLYWFTITRFIVWIMSLVSYSTVY